MFQTRRFKKDVRAGRHPLETANSLSAYLASASRESERHEGDVATECRDMLICGDKVTIMLKQPLVRAVNDSPLY
jgi:hypothetical protein